MQNKELTPKEIKRSLNFSILDGFFYSIMLGFGESFFQAYSIFLKANNFQIGLLGSIPQAVGSFSQLFTLRLLRFFRSRKSFVFRGVLLHGLMYIPIILVYYFNGFSVDLLIIFVVLYWIFTSVINPVWNSWMGDLVSENERGAYFGSRNKICGLATFFTMLAAGFLLQRFNTTRETEFYGFAIILFTAFVARMVSGFFLSKQAEPNYVREKHKDYTFRAFLKDITSTNYGLFVFYYCLMNFAVYLSAPYFTAYILNDLKYNYLQLTLINSSILIVKYIFMPIWGKKGDQYGTRKILSLTGLLMPLNPILWVFSGNFYYLIVIQVIAGFTWAGYELAAFNFLFDTTNPKKRAASVAYFNVLNGIAILAGGIAGNFITKYNNIFWSKFIFLFLVSGILRYIISFVFIPKLKEVREVEYIPYHKLLFKIIRTMTTEGIINDLLILKKKK
jgi:MFS family permease